VSPADQRHRSEHRLPQHDSLPPLGQQLPSALSWQAPRASATLLRGTGSNVEPVAGSWRARVHFGTARAHANHCEQHPYRLRGPLARRLPTSCPRARHWDLPGLRLTGFHRTAACGDALLAAVRGERTHECRQSGVCRDQGQRTFRTAGRAARVDRRGKVRRVPRWAASGGNCAPVKRGVDKSCDTSRLVPRLAFRQAPAMWSQIASLPVLGKALSMKSKMVAVSLAAALAVVLGVGSQAQVKVGKTRPLTTKQLMAGHVGLNCGALNKALQGNGPADEAGWTDAATRAALLNESSYTLMDDSRCPDAKWAEACMTLRNCSKVVLEKVTAKDAAGARGAFTAMTGACSSCHAAHKK